MRKAAQSRGAPALSLVPLGLAVSSLACAFADAPAQAHGALSEVAGLAASLSARLLTPAAALAFVLFLLLAYRRGRAQKRDALPLAPPPRYAPYTLPARAAVALAAAARARGA